MPHDSLLQRLWSRLNGSLRARLFIPIAFFSTALILVMVWAAVQIHGADMKRATVERARLFANLAAEGLSGNMLEGDLGEVELLVSALKAHRTEIKAVSVADASGQIRFSSDPALVGQTPFPLELSRPIDHPDAFTVLKPMGNEPRCAGCHGQRSQVNGYLAVSFSKDPLIAAERKLTWSLLLAAIPALVLLLGVTLYLVRREAIGPIHALVRAMKRAEGVDDDVRADVGRPDEIGIAARNFDATMAALRRSRAELEKTYELRMIQADRFVMAGQLATGLAHEIKNPLAGLSGALELLADDLAGSPQREMVGEMQHQVDRLTQIMESLLSYARPSRAQLRSTNVNAVLEKVLFLVSRQRQQSRVELKRAFAPDLPSVRADAAQLEQVFLNVAINAYQAINGRGGTITIRTFVADEGVCVEIQDDGPGIPADVRPDVFVPFFTTRANGTGLGLSISARLVAEQGGHIRFHCPPEGGTTFIVTLPVAQSTASVALPCPSPQAAA